MQKKWSKTAAFHFTAVVLHDETVSIIQTFVGPLKPLARKTIGVSEHNQVLRIMPYTTMWRRLGWNGVIEGQGNMGKGVPCGVSLYRLFISGACRKSISFNLSKCYRSE